MKVHTHITKQTKRGGRIEVEERRSKGEGWVVRWEVRSKGEEW